MGIFFVDCEVEPPDGSARPQLMEQMLVDTGSEYTWLPSEDLERAGITVRKKDLEFVMANGQVITRPVGYAILRCQGFETVDEVVFGQPGDLRLLGSRTLDGFGAVVDARRQKLVAAGPYPVARSVWSSASSCSS